MLAFINLFIKDLWHKSIRRESLSFFQTFIFILLCAVEPLYKIFFFIVQSIKKRMGNKFVSDLKVISVGNLSVGGTGKTVFIQFLAKTLGVCESAIISRGYGAMLDGENILVSDGFNIFYKPEICGDEPFMLAKNLSIAVVVGGDRYKSCLLAKNSLDSLKYILMDDSYQNFRLKKNFEILLMDARFPFGFNGHCLPAGNLREMDYSRADVIILTHANLVSPERILEIKSKMISDFDTDKIYCGYHKGVGLFNYDSLEADDFLLSCGKFMLLAGIGNISGFINGVEALGVKIDKVYEFGDHHFYLRDEIVKLLQEFKDGGFTGIITTQKDWVKLKFILDESELKYFYVFRVEFVFLSQAEYSSFIKILKSRLM